MLKSSLLLIFVIALILRWLYLPQWAITFGYDQGRDAFIVGQMLDRDIKIQGPPVGGLPGVFHGVFYYYIVAPAYYFGQGSPIIAAFWMSFLSSLGVFVVYFFTYKFTKKNLPSFLAALLYAFSFEATQYANWLSNAALGIIFVPIVYLGIWLWFKERKKFGPIITGLALGLAIQCNAALAFHLLPTLFWIYKNRSFVSLKALVNFVISLFISLSSMILSEIMFNKGGLGGIWYLFSSKDEIASAVRLGDFLVNYFNQLGSVFSLNLFPLNLVFGGIIGFGIIIWMSVKKNNFLVNLILSAFLGYAFALSFGGGSTPHITVGLGALLTIVTGIFIYEIFQKNKLIAISFLSIILAANLFKIVTENKNGQTNFAIQKGLVLGRELAAIDYTYEKAGNDPFSISSLTSPLYINTTWSYLYNWYGLNKYGRLPYWIGQNQIGQLGNNLDSPPKDVTRHFYIIEPTHSIPQLYIDYSKGDQDAISFLVDKKAFGTIIVEERKLKN